MKRPQSIYISWASHDELSDTVELTEKLILQQMAEMRRLKERGVRFDYFLIDAFWYAKEGGYRQWRKPHWPQGPERWFRECGEMGVKPALWFANNNCAPMTKLGVHPAWRDSLDPWGNSLCYFEGGFWPHFLETLHQYYQRGVRLFKMDFSNFDAATAKGLKRLLPTEIRELNIRTYLTGLGQFRQEHPDAVFLGYNGYEEPLCCSKDWSRQSYQTGTSFPPAKVIDPRWLTVFDAMYCGDPRPADVPAMNFWRSKDVYSDHMVRVYHESGLPLSRIDNSGFMIGTTGTCYFRKKAAWKGMLLLSLARGGWANTYYGNLDLLTNADAAWFGKAQGMYEALQHHGVTRCFGEWPGTGKPYGFAMSRGNGGLLTVVNPGQTVATLAFPEEFSHPREMRLLFADDGFEPKLKGSQVTLGPEQMAVIGVGYFSEERFDLGRQTDVVIPSSIRPLPLKIKTQTDKKIVGTLKIPKADRVRLVMRQTDSNGFALRTSGGSPPKGVTLGKLLRLSAWSGSTKPLKVKINYDKAIWSGLSWAVGEIELDGLRVGGEIRVQAESQETRPGQMTLEAYHLWRQ